MNGPRRSAAKPQQRQRSRLEVQIHPSDIQRGVRYLFLGRRHFGALAVGTLGYLGLVAFAIWVAPSVVERWRSRHDFEAQLVTQAELTQRLAHQQARFEELEAESDALRVRLGKVYLAYGLVNESIGQGGYPAQPMALPDSVIGAELSRSAEVEARLREGADVLAAFLEEIRLFESAHADQLQTTPSISPLKDEFVLTSPFGDRRNPFTKAHDFHAGIDLSAPAGTPVYAPADGVVNFAGRYSSRQSVAWWRYGNLVSIRNGQEFVTLFGHLDQIKVKTGQRVRQGDLIALVGSTGWSTNPHLHYEVRRIAENDDFKPVDPRLYILDHRWRDDEQLLVRARSAPSTENFEPLPRRLAR
jgi:murein DD-endopeptidase MepM/ murein hydrolase activator NlpD